MRALRCALTKRPSPGITNLPAAPLASLTASLKSSSKNVVAVFFGVPTFSAMCPTTFVLRSEEHTSELQSRLHLVCRLLLEKKKLPRHCRPPCPTSRHLPPQPPFLTLITRVRPVVCVPIVVRSLMDVRPLMSSPVRVLADHA